MAVEIERKFLIDPQALGALPPGQIIKQGYVATADCTTVRIRVREDQAYLTLKGPTKGISRSEFEYPIPVDDAMAMLESLCQKPLIEKTRHLIEYAGHCWEVDIFCGDNQGLIVAEIELKSEDEAVKLPPWITQEVTGDPRYYNSSLMRFPYCQWPEQPSA